jgi:hypothetical protein
LDVIDKLYVLAIKQLIRLPLPPMGCCSLGTYDKISLSKSDFILIFVRNDTLYLSFRVFRKGGMREIYECATVPDAGSWRRPFKAKPSLSSGQ